MHASMNANDKTVAPTQQWEKTETSCKVYKILNMKLSVWFFFSRPNDWYFNATYPENFIKSPEPNKQLFSHKTVLSVLEQIDQSSEWGHRWKTRHQFSVDQSFLLKMISQHWTKETMCVSCTRSPAVVARGGYTPVFTHTAHGELQLHSSSQPDSRPGHESWVHTSVSHCCLRFLPVRPRSN